jgi:hypothetical protein
MNAATGGSVYKTLPRVNRPSLLTIVAIVCVATLIGAALVAVAGAIDLLPSPQTLRSGFL